MGLCGVVLLCVVCVLQVHGIEVIGYSGQSVVLKSGVDRSWNLTKVQWSIYKNFTYITRLNNGYPFFHNFWKYEGRLSLDSKTGDLTIHNVKTDDSLTYTVELVNSDGIQKQNKVRLMVQESLETPEVQNKMCSLSSHQCYVALECTASGQNVNLSWMPSKEFNGSTYISEIRNSSLVLLASFRGNRNVTFNCTVSRGQQTVTRQITVGCSEEKENQKCEVCTVCGSCTSSVMLAIAFTALATVLISYACRKYKDKIIDACTDVSSFSPKIISRTSPT
ncbi:uncharacterized protein si:cabz01074946.1 [Puntigrus tetrazona]|uniref:uncharacterized protein si:cabz01074946.1 n=1 Tax=Puntigrus tetrazona TaxID=1606681 RepID=UPI001C8A1358|nr:uncharacterized protein si:cabz01074946.1 [Puntigrus tetrazona]